MHATARAPASSARAALLMIGGLLGASLLSSPAGAAPLLAVRFDPLPPVPGATATWWVNFTVPGGLGPGDSVILDFPAGADPSAARLGANTTGATPASLRVEGSRVTLRLLANALPTPPLGKVAVEVHGILNPALAGERRVTVTTLDARGNARDGPSPSEAARFGVPLGDPLVTLSDDRAGEPADLTASFTHAERPFPANGTFVLRFPANLSLPESLAARVEVGDARVSAGPARAEVDAEGGIVRVTLDNDGPPFADGSRFHVTLFDVPNPRRGAYALVLLTEAGGLLLDGPSRTGDFRVLPGPAKSLRLALPAEAVAGAASDATVEALDVFGDRATGYRGAVRFDSTDPGATLPADYVFTPLDAGAHRFEAGVVLRRAGATRVSVLDADALRGAANVTVTPGPLAYVAVSPKSVSLAAGDGATFQAAASDAFDNVLTSGVSYAWRLEGGTSVATTGARIEYVAGATPGTFAVTVTSSSGGKRTNDSARVAITPAQEGPRPPGEPRGFSARLAGEGVALAWSGPADEGTAPVTGYRVLRGPAEDALVLLARVSADAQGYLDPAPPPGTEPYYAVRAENAAGEGPLAGPVRVSIPPPRPPPGEDPTRPRSPENGSDAGDPPGPGKPGPTPSPRPPPPVILDVAFEAAATTLTVSWTTDVPATSRVEYGSTLAYGHAVGPDGGLSVDHRLTLRGLDPGTVYHLRVVSASPDGGSAASPDLLARTLDPPRPEPLSVRIDNPIEFAVLAGEIRLQVSARGGPDRVLAYVDGNLVQTFLGDGAWTWDTRGVDDGEHNLTVRAYRGAEVVTASQTVTVRNSVAPPEWRPLVPLVIVAGAGAIGVGLWGLARLGRRL